jgi:hypothetical protein
MKFEKINNGWDKNLGNENHLYILHSTLGGVLGGGNLLRTCISSQSVVIADSCFGGGAFLVG